MTKISAGLERSFAKHGFAEPSVEDLRDAAGVSLRTLYKYMPSRGDMIRAALEHRHTRYLTHVFDGLPDDPIQARQDLLERVGHWMMDEASHGCLFHAAVAAAPEDAALRAILERHKSEVAQRAAKVTGLQGQEVALMVVLEGLTQSWPLHRQAAVDGAQQVIAALAKDRVAH